MALAKPLGTDPYRAICLDFNHDGVFTKLKASADSGCELCTLFTELDRTSPKPYPHDIFPDEPASPKDICYRICIDRTDKGTLETEASHPFAIEFYRKSAGPEYGRGYRSLGGPLVATPRLPKHVNFFFLRYEDDTGPRAPFPENFFYEDPHRKVVVEQSGWPILLAADAEDRGSVQALMPARKWIWQCLTTHSPCSRKAVKLPKRVIDFGSSPDSPIRLHIPEPEDNSVTPYISLSYSWGTDLPLRTTKETLGRYCEGIPFEDFPRTLQDALHVTRGLELRYIWIDALCIVQDDTHDWEEQAALMGEIYQGSMLNISATSASSLSSGFLQRSEEEPCPRVRIGQYFRKDGINHGGIHIGLFQSLGAFSSPGDLNETFLSSRGWVFQEQLMSTATLHYKAQEMVWGCTKAIRNEKFADAATVIIRQMLAGYSRLAPLKLGWINYLRSNKPEHFDRQRYGVLVPSTEKDDGFNILMSLWKEWVFDFSNRDLTYSKDRLPAITGITQLMSKKYGLRFAAVHFAEDMPPDLCWNPKSNRKVSLGGDHPKEKLKLPSWSWPSFPGGVWYGGPSKVHNLQTTCSQSPLDLKVLKFIHEADGSLDILGGPSLCLEVEGLLQAIQLECTYDSYDISIGVKLPNDVEWSVNFD